MATKYVAHNEAAKQLGLTADTLNEMRDAGEIRGFRDGSSFKYKAEEIERIAAEKGVSLSAGDDFDEILDDLDIDSPGAGSSVLVSDDSIGSVQESPSSTIIGDQGVGAADSDLRLVPAEDEDDDILLADADDDLELEPIADSTGSDLALDDPEDDIGLEPAGGTGDLAAASDELDLDGLDEDDLTVDIGAGSDVTLGTGDSGIDLASPADSGLSLEEEPLEIGSSASGLELPEDDEVISLGAEAGPDDATQLKQDEEFLLSPYDETGDDGGDESSGSQVIALEDSAAFEEVGEGEGLTPDDGGLAAELAGQAGDQGDLAPVQTMLPGRLPEAPYSLWNVAALGTILLLLSVSGVVLIDLIRSLWLQGGEQTISTGVTKAVAALFRL